MPQDGDEAIGHRKRKFEYSYSQTVPESPPRKNLHSAVIPTHSHPAHGIAIIPGQTQPESTDGSHHGTVIPESTQDIAVIPAHTQPECTHSSHLSSGKADSCQLGNCATAPLYIVCAVKVKLVLINYASILVAE